MTALGKLLGVRAAAPAAPARMPGNDRAPKGGSSSVWYSTPGQPQIPEWDGLTAIRSGYLASIYIMQPTRIISTALGSLPIRVGANPDKPGDYDPNAPLARLIGPPPGGPNPVTSSRNLLIWSLIQRLVAGRMAWETVCPPGSDTPAALWPLVAPFLNPIPSTPGTPRWFDGFRYQLPTGPIDYKPPQIFYSWRPSQTDWRQPESALQAANMPASLQIALDRYLWALAKNGLAAKKLVITPEFAEDDERRAWEEQFASEFTGYDNGGRVVHGYYEDSPDFAAGATGNRTPPIQVVDLATSPADAQVLEILKAVKDDMLRTWRVPLSWMGDSTQRTYENASQEAKNFWQGPVLELAAEWLDDVNQFLSPRFGDGKVAWFDFSRVEALKGSSIFGPITADAAVKAGLIVPDEWRVDVGLPPQNPADAAAEQPPPEPDDTPGGTSYTNFSRRDTGRRADAPTVAGLAVKAADTGRVLLLQRAMTDDDPAAGRWEFPGGHAEDGEDLLAAAVREWMEETGSVLPAGQVVDSWDAPNGIYRGFVYVIPAEADLDLHVGRDGRLVNPDDPDCDMPETAAWFDVADLPKMPALRPEVRKTPWAKLATAQAPRSAQQRYDVSPIGLGKNWVTSVGGLPLFIRAVAHALIRSGHSESRAIELAVGVVRNWAEGKGKVTPKTRAKAAAAIAEWERKKAQAHATPDKRDVTEAGTSGLLLPKAPSPAAAQAILRHMFAPSQANRRRCGVPGCGKPVTARIHGLVSGSRHAGPDGHEHRPSGHAPSLTRLRRRTVRTVNAHADELEAQMAEVMRGLFAKQEKATLSRLEGRRGQQMLRAAQPPDDGQPQEVTSGAPDVGRVFDFAHWVAQTQDAVNPVYLALQGRTATRLAADLHPGQPVFPQAVDAAKAALQGRVTALADAVTRTTYDEIAKALAEGVANGEGVQGLAKRVREVFADASQTRAETIARTEVMSSLNASQDVYARNLPSGTVAAKEWLATPDSRTRPTHREANGQRRQLGEAFDVGGFPMRHPGDHTAPPDEWINCRCTTLYVPARMASPAAQAA